MRSFLDACVLVPTLTRGLLLDAAQAGVLEPLWSPGVLDEWRHAAARVGPFQTLSAEHEIAAMTAACPQACVTPPPDLVETLHLPDPGDRHVLAAAIAGRAEALVTFNERDFPLRVMGAHGLIRRHPDGVLREAAGDTALADAFRARFAEAVAHTGRSPRALAKAAHLPRLGKLLFSGD